MGLVLLAAVNVFYILCVLLFVAGVALWCYLQSKAADRRAESADRVAQERRRNWYESVEPKLRNTLGYPGDWRLRRIEVFLRADGKCESCGKVTGRLKSGPLSFSSTVDRERAWHYDHVKVSGAHVHHKVEISKGGSHSLSNLELLCDDCHAAKHPHNPYLQNFRANVEKERRRRSVYFGNGASVKRARREWTCYICERTIPPGDEYFGGNYAKVCMKCKERLRGS